MLPGVITELRVSGWRCLKDVTLALTPLHALVGPNDSGKSTILEALLRAQRLQLPHDDPRTTLRLRGLGVEVALVRGSDPEGPTEPTDREAAKRPEWARRLRLDPDALRRPSPLLTDEGVELSERGEQLAGVYDALLGGNRDAWETIEASVRVCFPTVRRLVLRNVPPSYKALGIELHDRTLVPAEHMSEGLLLWLAVAALPYVSPTRLLLIEAPETGLHPARLREVVDVLRQLVASGTQVVCATHSARLVDLLQPDEVSVVTRTSEAGTRVRRFASLGESLEEAGLREG